MSQPIILFISIFNWSSMLVPFSGTAGFTGFGAGFTGVGVVGVNSRSLVFGLVSTSFFPKRWLAASANKKRCAYCCQIVSFGLALPYLVLALF